MPHHPPQPKAKTSNDLADLAESGYSGYEGVGLGEAAGWYTSAVLYGAAGLIMLSTDALSEKLTLEGPPRYLTFLAILLSPVFVLAAHRFKSQGLSAHLRVTLGFAMLASMMVFFDDGRGALVALYLFPLLAPAYLYPIKQASAYAIGGIVLIAGTLMFADETGIGARVPITTLTFSIACFGLILAQHRYRMLAASSAVLSVIDPLTGYGNVRRLRSRLDAEIARRQPQNTELVAFSVDLDNFKQVNDRFSHALGDQLLCAVADAISDELRPGDLLARRGGDEFVVIARVPAGFDLQRLQDRLAHAAAEARFAICPEVTPTASIGHAVYQSSDSADALLEQADIALHESKAVARADRRSNSRAPASDPHIAALTAGSRAAGQATDDLEAARWARRTLGTSSAWFNAGVLFGLTGAIALGVALAGLAPDVLRLGPMLALGAMTGLAIICLYASRHNVPSGALHAALLAAMGFLGAAILLAHESQSALADLLLAPTLFAFYFMTQRQAWVYFVVSSGLFTVALKSAPLYPLPTARALVTMLAVGVIGAMLAHSRSMTRGFIEQSVELSEIDPLTGAANLRGMRRAFDNLGTRSENRRIVLFLVDLDEFKQVNDLHNHAIGDEVLEASVRAMRRALGPEAIVGRRGGDEFAAICSLPAYYDPSSLVTKIAADIERARRNLCDDVRPTASVAYTILRLGESWDNVLRRADFKLHDAKEVARSGYATSMPVDDIGEQTLA